MDTEEFFHAGGVHQCYKDGQPFKDGVFVVAYVDCAPAGSGLPVRGGRAAFGRASTAWTSLSAPTPPRASPTGTNSPTMT